MAISKDKKKELIEQYVQDLQGANSVVILQQKGISVPNSTSIRKDITASNDRLNVIRKRLFLKALEGTEYEKIDLEKMQGPVMALYVNGEAGACLKTISKYVKQFKKDKKGAELAFLGGWFDKKRHTPEYVSELADIPTKEELISKLMRLLKYPMQSLTSVLDQISKK